MPVELIKRFVQGEQLPVVHAGCEVESIKGHAFHAAAMSLTVFPAGIVNEDAAHGFGGGGKEMCTVFPLRLVIAAEPQPRLVNERGCLQRLARIFTRHFLRGKFAKLFVHERQEFVRRVWIALVHALKNDGEIAHAGWFNGFCGRIEAGNIPVTKRDGLRPCGVGFDWQDSGGVGRINFMNIHHLELFYYVARHGGISQAVRNMPYGIQQPAVSGQVIQLEESLGVTLFHRRPFALTPQGAELYRFIKPFFDNLVPMAEKLRGGVSQHLRIAASEIVLRDHLPAILRRMRKRFPKLKVTLREGYIPEVVDWLQDKEVDVSIGLLGGKPPEGVTALPLFELPLVLLVSKDSKIKSAEELWSRDRIDETLITVPSNGVICRAFQNGLARLKVDWFSGIEVSSIDLVQTYVENGYGIGVTVDIPKMKQRHSVRMLPLEGFERVTFGLLWQGRKAEVLDALVAELQADVRRLLSDNAGSLSPK